MMKRLLSLKFLLLITSINLLANGTRSEFSPKDPSDKKGLYLLPALSLFLPGLDQYIEGQTKYAASYTVTAFLGLQIYSNNPNKTSNLSIKNQTDEYRYGLGTFGGKLYETAGSLSAYHSFRTAVKSRPKDFEFLKSEDSIAEILFSPFNFNYLTNYEVTIPLVSLLLLSTTEKKTFKTPLVERLNSTIGLSFLAATGEEVLYRGWLMPAMHYQFDSALTANIIQSLIFGGLHYDGSHIPIAQTILGFYFGYLIQEDKYSMKRSIFIHYWWDAIIFARNLLIPKSMKKPLQIELFNLHF